MSFLGIRCLPASCSRPLARTHHLRHFSSSRPQLERQALGRIIPKRIAVRVPRADAEEGMPKKSIFPPIIFCILLGGYGYTYAANYTDIDTQKWIRRIRGDSWWSKGLQAPRDREMAHVQHVERIKVAREKAEKVAATLASILPRPIYVPIMRIYITVGEYYLNSPPASTVPMSIAAGLGTVWVAWRFKSLEPFMRKWFLHHPVVFGGGLRAKWQQSVTLFTSTISHQSLPHLAFNSIALTSFGAASYSFLASPPPGEPYHLSSTHTPHFLAFLLLAGLFSSLSSHLYTNLFRLPRLMRALSNPARLSSPRALAAHQAILPSLGASGAIYAALTLTACAYPDTSIGIIFIPFLSFPIGLGVAGMVTLDVVGLIRGWRMFDHVAHLGGAFFGMLYYQYGRQAWFWMRKQMGDARKRVAEKQRAEIEKAGAQRS